jgi:RNA polymerase sigma factor (sigma-70 family)
MSRSPQETDPSLLERLRDVGDAAAWREFVHLYRPLIVYYACRRGLAPDVADDVAQQCLQVLLAKLPTFERRVSFRGWLRAIVENHVRKHLARQREAQAGTQVLANLEDSATAVEDLWDKHWHYVHLLHCLSDLRSELASHNLQAFELYVLREMPVYQVAELLGMTANQVYVAKSRVMRRLKERYGALLGRLYGAMP